MGMEFKKVLFGYNVEDVELKIKYTKDDFNRKYKECQDDFNALKSENEKLNQESSGLTEELEIQQGFNAKIERMLRNSYEKTSQDLYDAKTKLDSNIDEKSMELESLHNKNKDINNSLNKILDKLENILSGY
jgi:hypothetical protein